MDRPRGRLAPRLRLDLALGDRLLAVDAGADAARHRRLIRVFALRTAAVCDAVGLKAHLATLPLTVGDDLHTPRVAVLLGKPPAIPGLQKRSGMAVTYSRVVELVFVTMLMRYGGEKVSE